MSAPGEAGAAAGPSPGHVPPVPNVSCGTATSLRPDDADGYRPIACGLYDRLEAAALAARPVRLAFVDGAERTARVADVYAAGPADWLRLDDGTVVRLDRVRAVTPA